jgi:tRNA threonylcarbamoyladenosine biosynthesis protein TsaE
MSQKLLREWKKVLLSDLTYIVYELKELTKSPAMILLEGPLGAGKTTFVQEFIGPGQDILSPTYSILSETKALLHGDFYRLENEEEIVQLELSVYLENKSYFMAEWGRKYFRRLLRELPESWETYLLEIQPEATSSQGTRHFKLSQLSEL